MRETQAGKFCATPFGVDIVGITEVLGLIGAVVGGKVNLIANENKLCHGCSVSYSFRYSSQDIVSNHVM